MICRPSPYDIWFFVLSKQQGQTGSESNISIGSFGSDIESASGYTSTPEKPDKEKGDHRKGKKRKGGLNIDLSQHVPWCWK